MILPFEINSYVKCYHNRAFPLGIIQGNANCDIIPWLCGKYINCSFDRLSYGMKFDICLYDAWGNKERVTSSQSIALDSQSYEFLEFDKLEIVKRLLDHGYYVHGGYNEKYIPTKFAYQKYDCPHDYLLIGYDEKEQKLISVGYTNRNKYERFEIRYEDYILSLKNQYVEINTCKYNHEFKFEFDIQKVINGLTDYINSVSFEDMYPQKKIYGLAAIDELKQFFLSQARENKYIDTRYIRALYEHRRIMYYRLKYIFENVIKNNLEIVNEYEKSNRLADQILFLAIKYNILKDSLIIDRVAQNINSIVELDKVVIPLVIQLLNENKNSCTNGD